MSPLICLRGAPLRTDGNYERGSRHAYLAGTFNARECKFNADKTDLDWTPT